MNIIFAIIFLSCTFLLLCTSPENFLVAMLNGASKAATLCVSLLATYAVWMGLMRVWESSGVARGVSKLLRPLAKKILKTEDEQALESACMSFSVNMLGISGAATPYGVKTVQLLDKTPNAEYSSAMFFVLNATSLQILPSSLVAVRVAMHSASPMDIIFPTLLVSLFSTVLGAVLVKVFIPSISTSKKREKSTVKITKKQKTVGAGTR